MIILLVLLLTQVVSPRQELSAHQRIQIIRDGLGGVKGKTSITTLNDLVDFVLIETRLLIANMKLDPMKLPPLKQELSFKPLFITYTSEMGFEEGQATGLSGIYRNGSIFMEYNKRVLNLRVPLLIPRLSYGVDYKAKLMGLGPYGHVDATSKDIQVACWIALDLSTWVIELKEFDIDIRKLIRVKMSGGIELADWITNAMIYLISGIFEYITKVFIRETLRAAMVVAIDALNGVLQTYVKPYFENLNAENLVYRDLEGAFQNITFEE